MGHWVVILLHVFTLQYVISQPVRDYIFAYIPIEEFEYLTNIEAFPTTSYQLVLPGNYETGPIIVIDETTYYPGSFDSIGGGGIPVFLNQGFPVYSVSSVFPVYQHVSVPTISVLPTVSVPTISISTPASFPTTSISIPTLPVTYVKYNIGYEDPAPEEVVMPAVASNPVTTVPISGTMGFNGMVPASGKIKIYAQCF